jgi:GMP reductase
MNINELNIGLNYKNILLKSRKSIVDSRAECDISTEIAGKRIVAPCFCSNMPSVLNKDICKIFDDAGWIHIYHRLGGVEDITQYVRTANFNNWRFCSISIGLGDEYYNLLTRLYDNRYTIHSICIDVAHSWNDQTSTMIGFIKSKFPNAYLIVGNGDNPAWIEWLEKMGVDAAKMNIGVSSSCRTKEYTGFGSTTVTDLIRCTSAANKIKIISDGGLTLSNNEIWIGDIAKSIKFGADYVMSGALFKNCLDSPAIKNGYYGNASRKAKGNTHVEGTTLSVETNGLTIKEMIKLTEESLRSSVSYSGGKNLQSLKDVDYQVVL